MTKPVFRFAPSPNGYLHLGHAYSALVTSAMARRHGGRFLLRLEDIDIERCRREFEEQILDDLAWLGLVWEEPVRRQSDHMAFYAEGVEKLDALGVLYPCFATRKEILQAVQLHDDGSYDTDPDGAPFYPGLHKSLAGEDVAQRKAAGNAHALRLDMQKALALADKILNEPLSFQEIDEKGHISKRPADPGRWGDVVVARKNSSTSYHLSVVMDDALQSVTHVTRGVDLYAATDVHRLLQILLDLPEPIYHHHRLITDEAGRKLSKSDQDKSLRSLREEGRASDIRKILGIQT